MKEYHKIQTVFKRDANTNHKSLLVGQFSLPEFEYLQNNQWIFTEKVDGTNIRVMISHERNDITFGGKTDRAQIPSPLVAFLMGKFLPQAEKMLSVLEGEVCLYGEGFGAGIQKGGNYRPDQSFVLFDVKADDWWLRRGDVEEVAKGLDIEVVPVIDEGDLIDMVDLVQKGFKSSWGDFIAEGIVARPKTELQTRSGERIITKIKHKDFREVKP